MPELQEYAFDEIIRIAIAAVVIFITLFAILYVIWGGFLLIISGGNEEKIKPAVNHIRHAILGVLFLFCIIYIFPILMNLVGVPFGDYAKPSTIFQTIGEIFDMIFSTSTGTPLFTPETNNELPSNFSTDF